MSQDNVSKDSLPQCLVIDVGSQSVRSAVMNRHGELSCLHAEAVSFDRSEELGWSEWALNDAWASITQVVRSTLNAMESVWHGSRVPHVQGIAITVMRNSLVWLDEQGSPLRSCITWKDGRRASGHALASVPWLNALDSVGLAGPFRKHASYSMVNWVNENQPQLASRTRYVGFLSAYLYFKLTGRWVDAVASQVGYLPFDYRRQRWQNQNHWMSRLLGVNVDQLPILQQAGKLMGGLIPAVAAEWGLDAGTPIVAAGADKACELLGAGGVEDNAISVSSGTSISVCATDGRWRSSVFGSPCFPAIKPMHYITEYTIGRGFWLISWFIREFCSDIKHDSDGAGMAPEHLLDDWLSTVPAGCDGLVVQPFWSVPSRYFGTEARGAILGIQDYHRRGHYLRGILEGLMFEVRACVELLRMRFDEPFTTLVVSGGGAESETWLQMLASGTGMEVVRPKEREASLVGAGLCAGLGLGWWSSFEEAQQQAVHGSDRYVPRLDEQAVYNKLYQSVYVQLFPRLHPLDRILAKLVRYRGGG